MLAYILLFLASVYHAARWQFVYRLKQRHTWVEFASMLVIGVASVFMLVAYMALEHDNRDVRAILGTVVVGIVIDIACDTYPSSGCAAYITALAFFAGKKNLKLVYFYTSCLLILLSVCLFSAKRATHTKTE